MPQPLFDVFFRGALLPGADPGEARDRLAALFGLGPTEVHRLFGGGSVCVKRAVDVDTASQLRGRFRDAGALVDIRPAEASTTPIAPAAESHEPPAAPLAAAGSEAGWTLGASRTAGLDLAPAGTNVADASAVPPPAIDTSHLSVAPPNTGSLEDCHREKPARPIGDISHLSLSDD
jgi:hypothetical protein